MSDDGGQLSDHRQARVVPGRVLEPEGAVVRRRELEELDMARRGVASAKAEARALLAQAREEATAERERGYAEGLEGARRSAAAQQVALRAEAVRLRAEAGERLIRLGTELARQVLHRELQLTPDALEQLARAALAEVSWCQRVTLKLHPEDAAGLAATHPRLAEALDPGAELRLESDPELTRGSCLVETESGDVDASVEVQLAALEAALLGERHE